MDVIQWLNANNGFVMSILSLVTVIATFFIMRANRSSVIEMRKTREEESRPFVVIYMGRDDRNRRIIRLVIENVGKTVARDVKITCTPPINHPSSMPLSNSYIFTQSIPTLAPKFKITTIVDSVQNLKQSNNTYPIYEIKVSYSNGGHKEYNDHFIIDLNIESDIIWLGEKSFTDFVDSFDSFAKSHSNTMTDLLRVLSDGKVKSTSDRELTIQELFMDNIKEKDV